MEHLLKAADVAEILNVRPTTVYAFVDRGTIPHVRVAQGRKRALIRFRRGDIEAFLRERTVAARSADQGEGPA